MSQGSSGDLARGPGELRLGRVVFDVSDWVYGTVTLMSVLVVYDGWAELKRTIGVVTVVLGPTIALALAHLFAEVLEFHVRHRRSPRATDWRSISARAAGFLLIALPPLAMLLVTSVLLRQSLSDSIRSMLLFGALSLGFWGGIAGHRAGYRGWRLGLATVAGLLIGLVVIVFQIALKPH